MKKVVSVSIGSSKRNAASQVELLGQQITIERIGTDGDIGKAIEIIKELDGKVDAFGMGGIDLYIGSMKRRYMIREAKKIAAAASKTPMVDGSGLKNTLERRVIKQLVEKDPTFFTGKNVLLVCAMDRFGMAESLAELDCGIIFGDFIFALGISLPIRNLKALDRLVRVFAPLAVQLPISFLYPTGKEQEKEKPNPKYFKFYEWADVIAGDFHMIKKHMPQDMSGKVIITNTVTANDVEQLKARGVSKLVTTTPNIHGRSFGTNVMEALIVALLGKKAGEVTPEDYLEMLDKLGFEPRIEGFAPNIG
ncbi:MAG: quinate 5-dehydrogenase [Firmicutes bacterium]|nr:quinate 5-dehydrogenase [Bacillota bacterium]